MCPDVHSLSALALAFYGDAVYELLARGWVLQDGARPIGALHARTVEWVRASAQARAYAVLEGLVDEEELRQLKRGRGASKTAVPKSACPADYRHATGVETLFGYLWLSGRQERAQELFSLLAAALCADDSTAAAEETV